MNSDIHCDLSEDENIMNSKCEKFDARTEIVFGWLQISSAILGIFAHGSNDVANAVGPYSAMFGIWKKNNVSSSVHVPIWISFIGSIGMSVGILTYGFPVMKSLGVRITAMSQSRGYCIQVSAALVMIIASYYGYPASTTNAQVGATIGVGLMEYTHALSKSQENKDEKLTINQVINWWMVGKVFASWALALGLCGTMSALVFSYMAYSPSAM